MARRSIWTVACGLTVFLTWAANLPAAPLELKLVSADAKWLGHVDFDALRDSTVMQRLVKKAMERHPAADNVLKTVKEISGFDPRHDLHGATFYGNEIAPHKGVLVLQANLDRKKLSTLAEMLPNREMSKHGDHELMSWQHEHHGHKGVVAAAFCGENKLVLASSVDELKAALDVCDGKAAGLKADSSLGGNIPPGTTVLFRVNGLSEAKLPEHAKLVKQTESYRFVAGEHRGKSFFRSRSVMTNRAVVGQLAQVLAGLKALGELHVDDNTAGKNIVSGFKVKAEDKTLTVLWSGSADDVWSMIEYHAKMIEKHHARMHGRRGHGDRRPDAPRKAKPSSDEDF